MQVELADNFARFFALSSNIKSYEVLRILYLAASAQDFQRVVLMETSNSTFNYVQYYKEGKGLHI